MKSEKRNLLSAARSLFGLILTDTAETDFFGVCYQMAFFILLTFFPLVIFLINFVGGIISEFEGFMYSFMSNFLPDLVFNIVKELIDNLKFNVGSDNILLLLIAFLFACFAVRTVFLGLSQNYRNKRTLPFKRYWLLLCIGTFLFCLSLVFILAEYVVMNVVLIRVFTGLKLSQWVLKATMIFSNIFALISMSIGFLIIYTLASPQQMTMKHNLPGAVATPIILVVFFRIYLMIANNSIRYTLFYGDLGGFFLFMVVIYFFCVIINIGCKFNLYLYCFRHQNGILFPL